MKEVIADFEDRDDRYFEELERAEDIADAFFNWEE